MKAKITLMVLSFLLLATSHADDAFFPMAQLAFAPNSQTDAVLVYYKDQLIYEKYDNGFGIDNKHIAWSASKSITSAVIGSLVYQGLFDVQASVCQYYSIAQKYNHCDLTAHDFLSWSSGLIWNEQYENENGDPTQSSVAQLLYGDGAADAAQFVISHPVTTTRGWNYSTGDSNFLMGLAKNAVPANEADSFPWKYLFEPLGITDVTFGQDQSGTFGGGSAVYIKPRDLARIGHLYLHRGEWNGKRIFAESWVDYTNSAPELFDPNGPDGQDSFHSRRSWWALNPEISLAKNIPEALIANGHWGQFLIVIPSMDTVIVRMGNNQTTGFDIISMIELAVRGVEKYQGSK